MSGEDRTGSSEELQKDLRRELEASESLDKSLLTYLGGGGDLSEASRESSVLSEGGTAPLASEDQSNALRIQNLMRKVHKEGIQVSSVDRCARLRGTVLSETDRMGLVGKTG